MLIAQIIAVVIFVAMFVLIVLDVIGRQYVTLGCGLIMLVAVFGFCMKSWEAVSATLNVRSIFTSGFWIAQEGASESATGINWATIIFIFGMMIMVEGMAKAGFFRWLCLALAKIVKYKTLPIFIVFMIMSAVLAMFIDSITVILFLAAVTIELSKLLKFDPVPLILAEIFCANLGGSATMCGDPPNIIIGTSLNLSFADFLTNTGVIALVCLIVIIFYFFLVFKKKLKAETGETIDVSNIPAPRDAIKNKGHFILSCIIFGIAVVLLVTHAQTGLSVAFIGVAIAVLTLVSYIKSAREIIRGVDYHTLLFFIGLFIVVGGLEQTGILELIAGFIGKISGGNILIMIVIILWISAIASAFVDNIPFAATMVPIITSLAATQGVPLNTLAWTLAIGTDIGGSATPIGASANVVGTSVSAKSGHPIGWGRYCKYMAPATAIVIGISMLMIFIRYVW